MSILRVFDFGHKLQQKQLVLLLLKTSILLITYVLLYYICLNFSWLYGYVSALGNKSAVNFSEWGVYYLRRLNPRPYSFLQY